MKCFETRNPSGHCTSPACGQDQSPGSSWPGPVQLHPSSESSWPGGRGPALEVWFPVTTTGGHWHLCHAGPGFGGVRGAAGRLGQEHRGTCKAQVTGPTSLLLQQIKEKNNPKKLLALCHAVLQRHDLLLPAAVGCGTFPSSKAAEVSKNWEVKGRREAASDLTPAKPTPHSTAPSFPANAEQEPATRRQSQQYPNWK